MKIALYIVGFCLFILTFTNLAFSQKKQPEAYLRSAYQCQWQQASNQSLATCKEVDRLKYYAIEIYLPEKIADATFQEIAQGKGSSYGTVFANNEEQSYQIEISKNDPPVIDSDGKIDETKRSQRRLVVNLPKEADLSKNYLIFLQLPINNGAGASTIRRYVVQTASEFTPELLTDNNTNCRNRISLRLRFEDERTVTEPINQPVPPPDQIPLKYSPDFVSEYQQYVLFRQSTIISYLKRLQKIPALTKDSVKIEDPSKLIKPPAELKIVEKDGRLVDEKGDEWIPKPENLPSFTPEITFTPKRSGSSSEILVCLDTKEKIPTNDFSAMVSFPAIPDLEQPESQDSQTKTSQESIKPGEIKKDLAVTALKGRKTEISPEVFATTGEVGIRSVDHDFDIVGSFTSSVEDKDRPDPLDPTKTIKVRDRTTRATLDMIVAPFGIRTKICPNGFFKPCDRPVENGRSSENWAYYRVLTPLFIDAKVSSGKIKDDSLSLNRVLFGVQGDFNFIKPGSTMYYPTYFVLRGRFSNASDRDFKRAEYKGSLEFRPIFSFLNHPLANIEPTTQNAVVVDASNKKDPVKIFPRTQGGYQFVPFVGAELGRTWIRRGEPAEAVKPSDAVKRIYFGMDITLNPFPRTTVTLTDTFYFRLESKTDPRENYFKGSIDFRLGKFLNFEKFGQSIYFSYERGELAPFSTPAVNAFKIGYRIRGVGAFGN